MPQPNHYTTVNGSHIAHVYEPSWGLLHSINDQPSIIRANGLLEWYWYGNRHRVGGPAIIFPDKTQKWFKDGYLHREDGPAWYRSCGDCFWFLHGTEYTLEEFVKKTPYLKTDGERLMFYLKWK